MPTSRAHISNFSNQKSYASVQVVATTPSENLLREQSGRVLLFCWNTTMRPLDISKCMMQKVL